MCLYAFTWTQKRDFSPERDKIPNHPSNDIFVLTSFGVIITKGALKRNSVRQHCPALTGIFKCSLGIIRITVYLNCLKSHVLLPFFHSSAFCFEA